MQQAPPPKKLVDREQSWSAEHQTSPTPCAFHHQTSTCRHPIGRILTLNMSIPSQSTTSYHFRDAFDVQTTQQFFTSFSVSQCYPLINLTIILSVNLPSANLLSLNSTNTEFLVIGLPQQLAKVNNHTITITSNTTIIPVAK